MSVIENFAALSAQEQRDFANSLIETINSESIFSSEVDFEITEVEADELDGSLMIKVSHTDTIEVSRKATWQAADEEDASSDPGYDADYEESIYTDAEESFKTLSAVIDDYKVSLDIADIDETDTIDIEIDNIDHEDSGYGDYEYWGMRGHDSRPFVVVQGTIVKACECSLAFFVEVAEDVPEEDSEGSTPDEPAREAEPTEPDEPALEAEPDEPDPKEN